MIKPELVVFDIAGTTVHDDSDVQRVLTETLGNFGLSISLQKAALLMGIPKPLAITQVYQEINLKDPDPSLVSEMHNMFEESMLAFYEHDEAVREKAGASEIFEFLQINGISVYLDTGFNRRITDLVISRMGWSRSGLINGSISSDEVENGRPHPDMIYKAMQLSGTKDPAYVAKIGDTASDLLEGNSAGCGWVIGVTSGAYSADHLMDFPHTHLIDHLSELKQIWTLA